MRKLLFGIILLFVCSSMSGQEAKKINTGTFSGPFEMPLSSSTTINDISTLKWDVNFHSLPNEAEENIFHLKELKEKKNHEKRNAGIIENLSNSNKKTRGLGPIIGKSFRGMDLKSFTPTDNSIAVSKSGMIVSCINQGIAYYDTSGDTHLIGQSWTAFLNDTTLKSTKYDPRVIYDSLHDRFIVVLLHGFSSSKSKVLVCFSKTKYPLDGWNIYQFSGNPYSDTSWTDFPTIGISDEELFINGNRFGDPPNYAWKETYIYQIDLMNGYNGTTASYGLWNGISTPDSMDGYTLYPASNGLGQSMKEKMYFVQLMSDSGSNVYLYEINGLLSSTTKTLTSTQYQIPHYEVCANAFQKDPTSGFVDSLSTGGSWTQNAFYLNKVIHFTFDAEVIGNWCGINYGRIYLDSNKAVVTSFGEAGTDMCYPALASLGFDSTDKGVAIAFVRCDSSITLMPEVDVVACDSNLIWSGKKVVKKGDTSVNILYPPDYAIQPERWGDYTGMCRNYIAGQPQVWLAGGYGANTPPRYNSYGTWIAQIISGEAAPNTVPSIVNEQPGTILYPNPVVDMFTLEFNNEKDGNVIVNLYDLNGKIVQVLFDDFLRKSSNKLTFNKLMLSAGTYFVAVEREGEKVLTQKLIIQ